MERLSAYVRPLARVASRASGRAADLIDRLDLISAYLAAAGLAVMSGLVFSEVVLRSIFTRSTLIADEIASYLLAMVSFFALGYTLRTGGHIRVTLFFNQVLPQGTQAAGRDLRPHSTGGARLLDPMAG